ncbi:MAG: FG-GAP-like repeat-containing protein [Fuerstiella sp.]
MTDERSDTAPQHWARHKRRIGVALIAAVSTVALGLFVLSSPQQSATTILKNAEKAMKRQDFKAALELAEIGLQLESQRSDGRMFAADAAAQLGDAERSLRHCLLIPDSDAMYGLDARILTATLYRHLHKDRLAEEHLHRALQIAPDCIAAHKLLSSSYSRHGRRWESIPHLLALLRATSYDIQDLRLLAAPDSTTVLGNIDRVKLANSKDPYDLLAVACSMMALEQTPDLCEKLLQRCIAADESLLEAKVRYGRLLLNRGDSDLIENWDNSLPQQADEFPETWLIRAEWCMQSGKLLEAASCFLQALEMHPNHAAANYQLGQTLTRLGKGDEAEKFLLRAEHLRTIIKLSAILARQYPTPDQDLLHEITNSLELTGRYLEAICWLNMATSDDDITARRQHLYDQIGGQITSETPWTRPAFLATKELKFAISEWKSQIEQPDASQRNSRNKAPLSTNISFNDSTKTMGINHQFHFGAVDDKPTGRIFEITGGGIATLDFDLDDWPDLYLSQAGKSPPFQVQQTHFDQLYRNYQGKQFAEVAELASIHDDFFGQGVAAGDINNDGFPDLYVANIDGNQIYLNNGDGTFFNQTRYSNVNHRYWTTSCAIADITGDSIPDLYDVTYVDGDNILTLTCPANGTAGTCSPLEFDSPPDFLWQGVGDGTFTDSTKSTGFSAPLGTGLDWRS